MKSYFKFLSRNKLYTAIEAVGLAVSLAFVIIIGSYAWQQWSFPRVNPNREQIYVPGVPGLLALNYDFPDAAAKIPEIETIATLSYIGIQSDNTDLKSGIAVDRSFFDLFPEYHFLEGDADALTSRSNVILTADAARRNHLSLGDGIHIGDSDYTVGAILENRQATLFYSSEVFLPSEYRKATDPYNTIGSAICFLKVLPGTDRQVLYDKLETVCKEIYPQRYGNHGFERLEMLRYDEIFFQETGYSLFRHGDKKTLKALILVGLLLLFSAVFNYANLSVALTGKRAKEMAVRQLSGASRGNVMGRYICESVFFTALCFGAGVLLAVAFLPMMIRLLNYPDVPIWICFSPGYLFAYAGIVLAVGIVCGVIPAVIAGKYKTLDVMKGEFRRQSKMVFSKVFIVLQNALAVFLVALAITMEAQMRKTQSRPLHFNTEGIYTFYLYSSSDEDGSSLKDALEALPCVKRIGRCSDILGCGFSYVNSFTSPDGGEVPLSSFSMDTTAFRMFNFEIMDDYGTPLLNGVWLSDASYTACGLDNERCEIWSLFAFGSDHLAGTFKAFPINYSNMGKDGYGVVYVVGPEELKYSHWVIETVGDRKEACAKIKETYEAYAKDRDASVYSDGWLEDILAEEWKPARNNMRLVEIFMFLSIILSLLCLMAMSTYYADEKARDIAVRKVFGGTVETEAWHTIRNYMVLVGIACLIGVPIAVYAAQEYLKIFIYKLEGYWWIFVLTVILTLGVSLLSILWQTLKAAKTNPAVELKKE